MHRTKYVIANIEYETELVDGAITQINGLWFGFTKCWKYKKRGHSQYSYYRATELTTGMMVTNGDDEFLTRVEAVQFCRNVTDDVYEVLNSNKEHVDKLRKRVRERYEAEGMTDMIDRIYGNGSKGKKKG